MSTRAAFCATGATQSACGHRALYVHICGFVWEVCRFSLPGGATFAGQQVATAVYPQANVFSSVAAALPDKPCSESQATILVRGLMGHSLFFRAGSPPAVCAAHPFGTERQPSAVGWSGRLHSTPTLPCLAYSTFQRAPRTLADQPLALHLHCGRSTADALLALEGTSRAQRSLVWCLRRAAGIAGK